jgi:hypothetical protein
MIFRSRHRKNFTLIDNAAIRDSRLSLKATGLLALLLTYPDDTRFSREKIRSLKQDGVRGIRSALVELGRVGYLVHEYERDTKGRWKTITYVYETPQGTGEQFIPPPNSGAVCANDEPGAVCASSAATNGALRANSGFQNWRVSDGGKRATKRLSTDQQDTRTRASGRTDGLAGPKASPSLTPVTEPTREEQLARLAEARGLLEANGYEPADESFEQTELPMRYRRPDWPLIVDDDLAAQREIL